MLWELCFDLTLTSRAADLDGLMLYRPESDDLGQVNDLPRFNHFSRYIFEVQAAVGTLVGLMLLGFIRCLVLFESMPLMSLLPSGRAIRLWPLVLSLAFGSLV